MVRVPRAATHDRHGSHAGRGFRYQDAVATWLAVRVWARLDPPATIVPEGNDDVERRAAAGSTLVQVKSRREHLGALPTSAAREHVKSLWGRHDKFAPAPVGLELVVERGIEGHAADTQGRIAPDAAFQQALPGGERGRLLLAKTIIVESPEPAELSMRIIAATAGCSPLAAQLCFAQLLGEVGALADQNGRLKAADYRGLSPSDTARVVADTLGAVDVDLLEAALRDGTCEAVDFLTPLDDPDFYLGVDVQPGHVAAGLVLPRIAARDALADGLEARGAALVAGPSGAGKSAIMWDTAHALRHTVRWYRLARVDRRDIPALRRLLRTLRAAPGSPVGLVVDDVGRRGSEGWDALTREFSGIPGALLLGSIREEDLFLLEGRARAVEVRAEPEPHLARRLYDELRAAGRTQWPGWQEPWNRSRGLVLEYVHILAQGRRFEETLAGQVDARQRDPARTVEMSVLRLVALAGAAGATVEADRIAPALGLAEDDVGRGLRRLVDEHLVRNDGAGRLTGIHQLRSAELVRLTHLTPPPTLAATFARAVDAVAAQDLEPLVADALRAHGLGGPVVVAALAERIRRAPDIDALSAMLRGLGGAYISSAVGRWLAMPSVGALPTTQVGTAAMLGVAGLTLAIAVGRGPQVDAAAADLTAVKGDTAGDPRRVLLDALSPDLIGQLVSGAADPATLDRFLAAQVGAPMHPAVAQALDHASVDLLGGPLEGVVGLLGTLAVMDRARAVAWADTVGEDVLAARLPAEVPWAASVSFEDSPDGRVVRCDYRQIHDPTQGNPHDEVVGICQIALALSPRSDFAASTAIAPNGGRVGTADLALADKRIPRDGVPTAALPAWNRRWLDAIAARVASPTYSDYLQRAADLVRRLQPALDRAIEVILRGKRMPQAALDALGGIHEAATALTPPGVAAAEASDAREAEANTAVTKLQNVLFAASADVVRGFDRLPDGAGAFVATLRGLVADLDEAGRSEPWNLIGGVPEELAGLRGSLSALHGMGGEIADRGVLPAVHWAPAVRKARAGNALRAVGALVAQRTPSSRARLATELRDGLRGQGVEAEVHAAEDADAILPWPPSRVLVLAPLATATGAENFAPAVVAARQLLPEGIRLTVLPTLDGQALPGWSVSGNATLSIGQDDAEAWITRLDLPAFRSAIWNDFDQAAAAAAALQSIERLGLASAGRPAVEGEVRARLADEFEDRRAGVAAALTPLDADLARSADAMLAGVRSGEVAYADAVQEALAGGSPGLLDELTNLRIAIEQAELDRNAAEVG